MGWLSNSLFRAPALCGAASEAGKTHSGGAFTTCAGVHHMETAAPAKREEPRRRFRALPHARSPWAGRVPPASLVSVIPPNVTRSYFTETR